MASQHFDFTTQQGFPQTPGDALTIVRNSEAFPSVEGEATVQKVLVNKLMLTSAGLHVWEQRTNVVLDSVNFTAWSSRGVPVIQDRNQLAPDGTLTASTVTVGLNNTLDLFKVSSGLTPSTNHEASFWIKRISTTGFLRAQRTSSSLGQTGQWEIDMSLLPDDWTRLTENHPAVTATQNFKTGTTGLSGLFFFSVDGIERTFNLWGAQMEEGVTPSPYVSTAGAIVARVKDEITQPVSQMGFGIEKGMIVIDLVAPPVGSTGIQTVFTLSDGTVNNRLTLLRETSAYRLKHHIGGASSSFLVTGITDATRHKIAFGWTTDGSLNISIDGNTVQTFDTQGPNNLDPQTVFNLGSDEANNSQLNSTINSLTSYPDYSDALLQLRSTDRTRAIATNFYRRQRNG